VVILLFFSCYLISTPGLTTKDFKALEDFLYSDKTDERLYVNDSFVCVDFANQLKINSSKKGFTCHVVSLGEDHAVNLFSLSEGYCFIEPQTDEIWSVSLRKSYDVWSILR